jgi:hypothetical protein
VRDRGNLDSCSQIEDGTWSEISDCFRQIFVDLDEADHQRLFDLAIELTVDESRQGERFYIWNRIPCPECGSTARSSWGPVEPPEFEEDRTQRVTHVRWNARSDEMKKKLLNSCIDA